LLFFIITLLLCIQVCLSKILHPPLSYPVTSFPTNGNNFYLYLYPFICIQKNFLILKIIHIIESRNPSSNLIQLLYSINSLLINNGYISTPNLINPDMMAYRGYQKIWSFILFIIVNNGFTLICIMKIFFRWFVDWARYIILFKGLSTFFKCIEISIVKKLIFSSSRSRTEFFLISLFYMSFIYIFLQLWETFNDISFSLNTNLQINVCDHTL
jgi:hypothetical protein